jgi:phage terminase large subunit
LVSPAAQLGLWSYLKNGGTRAIEIWHRRSGKDEIALHWAAVAAHERVATYWHMLPEYAQGRKAIWTAVNAHTGRRRIDEAFPFELRANTNEQEMFIRFKCGSTWQVVGSDRYNAAVGSPPAGVTFSEWALADPASWGYLAPIVVENAGWAIFITTSRGRNHAKSMLDAARTSPEWHAQVLTADDTGAISKAAIDAQRKEYHAIFGEDAGDALIEQEYYCSFEAAVLGAYWGKELALAERQGRVCKVDIDPDYPVNTAWDIGIDDPMALWCFQVGHGVVNVVDYYESSGHGLDHYCGWLDDRGYHGIDWVPHDAKVREVGAPGGRTRIETMIKLGRKPRLQPDHKLMDGINAGRTTIPLARFDAERCAKGLDALREYKAEWDMGTRAFRKTPKHDWASHGADAWRGLSMSWREPVAADEVKPFRGATEMTIEEAWRLARTRRVIDARI